MTVYLEEDGHSDPNTAESHEKEATNHQRSSAHTLNSETLEGGQRGRSSCDWLTILDVKIKKGNSSMLISGG